MNSLEYLGSSFDQKTQRLDVQKANKEVYESKSKLNIVLFGATGVGKSSLVNAVFGDDVVKSGVGEPITQFLEKIEIKSKGLTLWDTKGIEAKDYESTKAMLIQDIEEGFNDALESDDDDKAPHVIWLCIKESSSRVEEREHDLLNIAKKFGIPTVVVFTDTQGEKGQEFFEKAKDNIDSRHEGFIKDRYVRVNSVPFKIHGISVPVSGLEELLKLTEDCLGEAKKNAEKQRLQKHIELLRMAQEVNMQIRLDAIIKSARAKVITVSNVAATVSTFPLPGSEIALVTAIQSRLLYTINSEFELNNNHSQVLAMTSAIIKLAINARIGKTSIYTGLKLIPGISTIIGGSLAASSLKSLTEAIGNAYIQLLEKYYDRSTGETTLPQQTSVALSFFKEKFEYELAEKDFIIGYKKLFRI